MPEGQYLLVFMSALPFARIEVVSSLGQYSFVGVHDKILAFGEKPPTGRGTARRAPTICGQLSGN
jgi:hypothetical protein